MTDQLKRLKERHRHLNRLIDNCRAAGRQEDLKPLKRMRLLLKDRINGIQRGFPAAC